MNILFSEDEWYYRDLGLTDRVGVKYTFGGMKFYRSSFDKLKQYDLFVCAYYTLPHNAILTVRFNQLGIKTALCSDGIFDFSNAFLNIMHRKYGVKQFHPIIQNFFLCVGEYESLYFTSEYVKAMDYMPKRMISRTDIVPLPLKPKVLVTTANTAYFNEAEYYRLVGLLSDVIIHLRESGVDYAVRLFDARLLDALSGKIQGHIVNDIDSCYEETLEKYSAVVTTPSSVAVVSMYHQRATAILVYRDNPMFLQSAWLVPSVEVFSASLDGFLTRDSEKMKIQNKLLENYSTEYGLTDRLQQVLECDGCSSDLSLEFINKSYENMLQSKFNINFEWYVRKAYRYLKTHRYLSETLNKIKKVIF